MAKRALGQSPSSSKGGEEGDPLEEAERFTKKMAASSIIESTVAKSKAEAEEAKARAEEARAKVRRAESGEDTSGGPFQVKGGLNLGTIDLQKEREETKQRLEELKREADEAARETGKENLQLREQIHELQIKQLQITFQSQIEALTKAIEAGSSRKSFLEQYTEAMETAKTLGFQMGQPSGSSSAEIQLQIKRLDFDHALALKTMAREDKAEERRWQLELRRLDDDRKNKEAELEAARKRDEMIASAPQMIGTAIARGFMEKEGGVVSQPVTGRVGHHIEAPPGEAGETNCPECGEVVGIGPTARAAVCPGCGLKIPIKRVTETSSKKPPTPPPPPEPKVEPEEE